GARPQAPGVGARLLQRKGRLRKGGGRGRGVAAQMRGTALRRCYARVAAARGRPTGAATEESRFRGACLGFRTAIATSGSRPLASAVWKYYKRASARTAVPLGTAVANPTAWMNSMTTRRLQFASALMVLVGGPFASADRYPTAAQMKGVRTATLYVAPDGAF